MSLIFTRRFRDHTAEQSFASFLVTEEYIHRRRYSRSVHHYLNILHIKSSHCVISKLP